MARIISRRQNDEHYKLYKGYVDKVQLLLKHPESTREWSRDFNYAYAGARLHQLYFEHINLPPVENKKMLRVIEDSFGSIAGWAQNMLELAMTCRPAGWVLTCYNESDHSLINIAIDSHDHLIPDMRVLIALDMYEHAYFIDVGVDKESYAKNFIEAMNWDLVRSRFERANQ